MRKMAYCRDCQKKRRISVEFTIVGEFNPKSEAVNFLGFGDIIIRCSHCYASLHGLLDSEEIKALNKAVVEAIDGVE
jgi:hypothetical protein